MADPYRTNRRQVASRNLDYGETAESYVERESQAIATQSSINQVDKDLEAIAAERKRRKEAATSAREQEQALRKNEAYLSSELKDRETAMKKLPEEKSKLDALATSAEETLKADEKLAADAGKRRLFGLMGPDPRAQKAADTLPESKVKAQQAREAATAVDVKIAQTAAQRSELEQAAKPYQERVRQLDQQQFLDRHEDLTGQRIPALIPAGGPARPAAAPSPAPTNSAPAVPTATPQAPAAAPTPPVSAAPSDSQTSTRFPKSPVRAEWDAEDRKAWASLDTDQKRVWISSLQNVAQAKADSTLAEATATEATKPVGELSWLEEARRAWNRTSPGIAKRMTGAARLLYNLGPDFIGKSPTAPAWIDHMAEWADEQVAQNRPSDSASTAFAPGNPRWWIANSIPTVTELAADIGLATLSGPAAPVTFMALGGAKMAGDQYNDAIDFYKKEGLTQQQAEDEAMAEAVLVGTVGALLDKLPATEFLTKNKLFTSSIRNILARHGLAGFTAEALPEVGQELTSMAAAAGMRNDPEAFKDWQGRLAAAGVLGGLAGAGVDISTGAISDLSARTRIAGAEDEINMLRERASQLDPRAAASDTADALNSMSISGYNGDLDRDMAGFNPATAEVPFTDSEHVAVLMAKRDAIASTERSKMLTPDSNKLEWALSQLDAAIAKKTVTPEQASIAAELTGEKLGQAIRADYAIQEAETEIATEGESTFLNPADWQKRLKDRAKLVGALREKVGAMEGGSKLAESEAFRRNLPIAREIAAYPAAQADPNGNGKPNGSSQRQIAMAIAKVARGIPLTAAEGNLLGSNGRPIFQTDKKTGRVTLTNPDTLGALESSSPLLAQSYKEYESRPVPQQTDPQTTQPEASQSQSPPSAQRDTAGSREGQPTTTEPQSSGITYRIPVARRGQEQSPRTIEFQANNEAEAREMLSDGRAFERSPLQSGEVFRDSDLAAVSPETRTAPAPAAETESRYASRMEQPPQAPASVPEKYRKIIEPLAKFFTSVEATDRPLGSGGFVFENGKLIISLPDAEAQITSASNARRKLVEEFIHSVTVALEQNGKINASEIFDALPEKLKISLRKSYPAAAKGKNSSFALGHEFLRMLIQRKVQFSEDGKVTWTDAGGQLLSEQSNPTLLAKLRDTLNAVLEYLGDLAVRLKREGVGDSTIASIRLAEKAVQEAITGVPETATAPAPEKAKAETPKNDNDNLQFTIPNPARAGILSFGQTIPESELYKGEEGGDSYGSSGYGREDDPHVTLLYGPNVPASRIQAAAQGLGSVPMTLGKVSIFSGKDSPYDVVKVDVSGDALHALHERLKAIFGTASEFKDYKPHITIAYVKKGEGAKYVGNTTFEGQTVTLDSFVHSDKDSKKTPVRLTNEQPQSQQVPPATEEVPSAPQQEPVQTAEQPAPEAGPAVESAVPPVDEIELARSLSEKEWEAANLPVEELGDFIRGEHLDQDSSAKRLSDRNLSRLFDYFTALGRTEKADVIQRELERRSYEEDQAENADAASEGLYELIEAVRGLGGIPMTDEKLQGEIKTIREGARAKAPGLFRNGAMPLDQLRASLEDYGFRFATSAELLEALETRLADGKPVYGSSFDFGEALASQAAPLPEVMPSRKEIIEIASGLANPPAGLDRLDMRLDFHLNTKLAHALAGWSMKPNDRAAALWPLWKDAIADVVASTPADPEAIGPVATVFPGGRAGSFPLVIRRAWDIARGANAAGTGMDYLNLLEIGQQLGADVPEATLRNANRMVFGNDRTSAEVMEDFRDELTGSDMLGETQTVEGLDGADVNMLFSQAATTDQRIRGAGQLAVKAAKAELTPEQRKLVTDNLALAGWAANRYRGIIGESAEDILSTARMGLIEAASSFKPDRGNFGSYAGTVIMNRLANAYSRSLTRAKYDGGSLDEPVPDTEGATRHDQIAARQTPGPDESGMSLLQDLLGRLPAKQRSILLAAGEDLDWRSIGEKVGMSHEGARKAGAKASAWLKERLNEAGITSSRDIFPDALASQAAPENEKVGKFWQDVAKDDYAFTLGPTPESKDMRKIMDELSPRSAAIDIVYNRTPSGKLWDITFHDSSGGWTRLDLGSPDFPFVDSSKSQGDGTLIYQTIYSWAHNNGKSIYPDIALSYVAEVRRTSQMLSSALRYGTTKHLIPAPKQALEGWMPGGSKEAATNNIGLLARKEAELVFSRLPLLKQYSYSNGYFYDADGNRIDPNDRETTLGRAIARVDSIFAERTGWRTAARALASVAAEAGVQPQAGNGPHSGAPASPSGPAERLPRQSLTDTLYSQPADIDFTALDRLESVALSRATGQPVGDPRLAFSTASDLWQTMDEWRKSQFQAQLDSEWQAAAEIMLRENPSLVEDTLIQKGMSGEMLNPVETKAAQILIANISARPRTESARRKIQYLINSYRETGTAAGRAMTARRDPHRTPAQRWREYFAKKIYTPPPAVRKLVEEAPSAKALQARITTLETRLQAAISQANAHERAAVEAELKAARQVASKEQILDSDYADRVRPLEEKLAKMGVTFDDILGGQVELRLMGAQIIRDVAKDLDARDKKIISHIQRTKGATSPEKISQQLSIPVREVRDVYNAYRAKLEDELAKQFMRGRTEAQLETVGVEDALMSQPVAMNEKEAREAARRAMAKMGFFDYSKLGRVKVRKATPPAMSPVHRRPTETPIPRDQIRQQQQLSLPPGEFQRPSDWEYMPPAERRLWEEQAAQMPTGEGRITDTGRLDLGEASPTNLTGEGRTTDTGRLDLGEASPTTMTGEGRVTDTGRLDLGETPYDRTGEGRTGERGLFSEFETPWDGDVAYTIDPESEVEMLHLARKIDTLQGGTWVDYVSEIGIANLLSAPITAFTNVTGYAYGAYDMSFKRILEASLNRGKVANAAQFGELRHMMRALAPGLSRAWVNAARAWSTESPMFARDVLDTQIEMHLNTADERLIRAYIPGWAGRIIRWPFRGLLAVDEFLKTMFGQMNAAAYAFRLAKARGLTGSGLERFIVAQIAQKGSPSWQWAVTEAERLSFQTPLRDRATTEATGEGNVVENLLRWLQDTKNTDTSGRHIGKQLQVFVLRLFFPFIRTPYRLVETGLENTIFGAIPMNIFADRDHKVRDPKTKKVIAVIKTNEEKKVALKASLLSAAFWTVAMFAVGEGDEDDDDKFILITGSRPREDNKNTPGLRQLAYRTVPQMSVRIGDKVWSYQRMDPFSTMIATTVDALRAAKETKRGGNIGTALGSVLTSIYSQISDKASLRGFNSMQDLFTGDIDPVQYFQDTLAAWLVPNALRNPLRNSDPVFRDTKSESTSLWYRAFPSPALAPPPAIDAYGREQERPGNWFTRTFVPGGVAEYKEPHPIDQFAQRYNLIHPNTKWAPATPENRKDRSTGERQMSADEFNKFLRLRGKLFVQYARESGVLEKQRPSDDDREVIQKAGSKATEEAKKILFGGK